MASTADVPSIVPFTPSQLDEPSPSTSSSTPLDPGFDSDFSCKAILKKKSEASSKYLPTLFAMAIGISRENLYKDRIGALEKKCCVKRGARIVCSL